MTKSASSLNIDFWVWRKSKTNWKNIQTWSVSGSKGNQRRNEKIFKLEAFFAISGNIAGNHFLESPRVVTLRCTDGSCRARKRAPRGGAPSQRKACEAAKGLARAGAAATCRFISGPARAVTPLNILLSSCQSLLNFLILASSGEFWRVLASFGEFGKVRESFGEFGKVLASSGKFWRVRESFGEFI